MHCLTRCESWRAKNSRSGNAIRTIRHSVSTNAATAFASFELGDHYRAVGLREGDVIVWLWIGTHEDYNRFRF